MVIDIKIAIGLDREVYQRMLLEKFKHVIEEADASIDRTLACAVEIETQGNLRFLCVSLYRCFSHFRKLLDVRPACSHP
jgi:hypothetical protein